MGGGPPCPEGERVDQRDKERLFKKKKSRLTEGNEREKSTLQEPTDENMGGRRKRKGREDEEELRKRRTVQKLMKGDWENLTGSQGNKTDDWEQVGGGKWGRGQQACLPPTPTYKYRARGHLDMLRRGTPRTRWRSS